MSVFNTRIPGNNTNPTTPVTVSPRQQKLSTLTTTPYRHNHFLITRHRAPHIFTRLEEDETIEETMQVANRMAEGKHNSNPYL